MPGFSTADTIVAIATPPGRGGLGIVRISGPDAAGIVSRLLGPGVSLKPRHATFATLNLGGTHSNPADHPGLSETKLRERAVLTYFVAPASYTGEDVVEISVHGSPIVLNAVIREAMDAGARLAEPGEFTLRAFLNGKMDLVQAEAVGDLIEAVTPLQARAAFDQLEGTLTSRIDEIDQALFDVVAKLEASLDFPDEGYHFVAPQEARTSINEVVSRIDKLLADASRGRLIREGAQIAIVGAPNAGKSSLFNALLNSNRAIVTDVPGTTRDVLTERAEIGGWLFSLIDTAGLRETSDIVEQEGVSRAKSTIAVADLIIVLLDRSRPLSQEDRELLDMTAHRPRVIALNKSDLPRAGSAVEQSVLQPLELSAKTGEGLPRLVESITRELSSGEPFRDSPAVTNIRHVRLLQRARHSLQDALGALDDGVSEEFPLLDLQEASAALQEITGKRTPEDVLRRIFERFCIGK